MRPAVAISIFKKELRETLRDRRTLFAMIVLPLLLYPALFLLMGSVFAGDEARLRAERPKIEYWGPVPQPVRTVLDSELRARSSSRDAGVPADTELASDLLRRGESDLIVLAKAGSDEEFGLEETVALTLFYRQVSPLSDRTFTEAAAVLEELNEDLRAARVETRDLPEGLAVPVAVEDRDLATPKERAGDVFGRFVVFILLSTVTFGAMYPAIDLTAGEKERGTMQTLLTAPVRSMEIVTGKFGVVVLVAVISAVVNLLSMRFAIGRALSSVEGGAASLSLGPSTFLVVFVLLIPVALIMAAILLTIGVFARTYKEAQTYMGPLVLLIFIPGVLSMSNTELSRTTALIPLVNVALAIRDVMKGTAANPLILLAFISNAVYAGMAIILAARVFDTEQVLLGGEKPWKDVIGRRLGKAVPSGRSSILFGLVLLVVVFYGSGLLVGRLSLPYATVMIQVLFLLAPAILWLKLGRYDPTKTFFLRLPRGWGLLGGVLVAAGLWTLGVLANAIQAAFFPEALPYLQELERIFTQGFAGVPTAGLVLMIAILPAVAEEVCFRGIILSGLRSTTTAAGAVLGSSLLFGLFHMDIGPYRIVPAAVLGAVLAIVVLRTGSIFLGMLAHAANNAFGVLAARVEAVESIARQPILIAVGGLSLVIGMLLLLFAGKAVKPAVDQDAQAVFSEGS